MEEIKMIDRFKGCLFGGAIGDALGYPVEFYKDYEIKDLFGGLVENYDLRKEKAEISDDTQMSLFTAVGLLWGTTRGETRGIFASYPTYIWYEYTDWYKMQTGKSIEMPHSWLVNVKELGEFRSPGATCMNVLKNDKCGSVNYPINNSKGCGGLMRVAPIGLYLEKRGYDKETMCIISAETAALTHGHDLGYIPAAMLNYIISRLLHGEELEDVIPEGLTLMKKLFSDKAHIQDFINIIEKAVRLASNVESDSDNIKILGEGWVAEETLAIAIYCSLKYKKDFKKAVCVSVSHGGDSDSTGAVTGNILGTYLGINDIPQELIEPLELKNVIDTVSTDLYEDNKVTEFSYDDNGKWEKKYITMTYSIEQ